MNIPLCQQSEVSLNWLTSFFVFYKIFLYSTSIDKIRQHHMLIYVLRGDNMILNHKEAISFLKVWMQDIEKISIKRYNDVVELLINNHYLLLIENKGFL